MLRVRLNNPGIILVPISNREKEQLERAKDIGDENIYVLYKLPDSEIIQIGMMSSFVRRHSPSLANISYLDSATSKAYFYGGGSKLESNAMRITDRPVYRIIPSGKRTVSGYEVLNGTLENGLAILLDAVVDGEYIVNGETTIIGVK